jgi:hypothetical protein
MVEHVLRMNEGRIPKKVCNMKVKGKCLRVRWEQQFRKMSHITKEERTWEEIEEE